MSSSNMELRIQRMSADTLNVSVCPATLVEELREVIRNEINVPVEQQRLIFRGRVLKNGQPLTAYSIESGSVLHLVERPLSVPEQQSEGNQAPSHQTTMHDTPFGRMFMSGGSVPGMANIMMHSVQINPDNPAQIASQITNSIMNAFHSMSNPTDNATSANEDPARTEGFTANLRVRRRSQQQQQGTATRLLSRPNASYRQGSGTSMADGLVNGHHLVRADTQRALNNLVSDLNRMTLCPNGTDLNYSQNQTNIPVSPTSSLLSQTLSSFERAFLLAARACHDLNVGIADNQVPWDRLHNFIALLQDLPLFTVVLRRLLSNIRSDGAGALNVPECLDVPMFLDAERTTTSNQIHNDDTVIIEPPE